MRCAPGNSACESADARYIVQQHSSLCATRERAENYLGRGSNDVASLPFVLNVGTSENHLRTSRFLPDHDDSSLKPTEQKLENVELFRVLAAAKPTRVRTPPCQLNRYDEAHLDIYKKSNQPLRIS